ncbi:DNA-directed RNA polymerase I subunit RPA2 [Marchantia polymorpha subsp. ruderalis]|uniref:DNA-directed RNA polymerase subunit beta n=2 Tax=Marchantia polymorpha TaxID=3197 RepID=A0AAF6B186_MARPO|nr:hypothetical protein MARPO_0004s0090 [Marchantia polymorpha]BBN05770.1 hypothetical protein Mp_3g15820 [Marchantia polymorpha subsp. ruderalis]|eukprot:PTQ48809.1 hypothetical protein MARPO_0004s0090 [Marchantia polymorpha]
MGKAKMNAARMGSGGPEVVAPEQLLDLMGPHIDSFDYFVNRGLQSAVQNMQSVEVVHPVSNVNLRMWLDKPVVNRPMKDQKDGALSLDQRLLPTECRMGGLSYRGSLTADLCLQYASGNVVRNSMSFGRMPIMVKSSLCHLRGLDGRKMVANKEEAMEMGGYFICNGIERIIRLLIIPKRNLVVGVKRATFKNRGSAYSDKAVMIRCVKHDQSAVTLRMYYLNTGGSNLGFSLRKQEFLIPVGLIIKALVDTSDREIYEQLISVQSGYDKSTKGVVGSQFVSQRARIILEDVQRLNLFTRIQCLQYIGERFKHLLDVPASYSSAKVGEKVLEDYILVNLDNPRDKFNMLIFMLHKLFALADGLASPDNADALQHHEILLPGHLLTIFVKERMQEWLYRVKALLVKEIEDKPAFNLQDSTQVQKILEKVPASDVSKKVEYLLNTGNLVTQSGLDLQQSTGFTLVAEKLNFLRYISHFRSVHRGAFFATLRTTLVRKLLPESWGFMCPVHTPDGSPCGLLNHLTAACLISTDLDARGLVRQPLKIRKAVTSELVSVGMLPSVLSMARVAPPDFLTVHLDGRIIGHMRTLDIPPAVAHLRHCKVAKIADIPSDLEVAYVPCTSAGAYPGLFLFSTPGRMLRPVKCLSPQDKGALELIGPYEQAYMEIKCPDGTDGGTTGISSYATHEETHALAMLSVVASLTPWSDHNQSPRNMYQCQMGKQTMGTPCQALQFRADNKLYRIQSPQTPVARTENWAKFNVDQFPTGTNAIVAVLAYTGYDMEDAMILNKSAVERGMFHGQIYKTETIDLTRMRRKGDGIVNVFARSDAAGGPKRGAPPVQNSNFVDTDGLPYIGQTLVENNPYCSVLNTVTGNAKMSKLKGGDRAVVDFVAAVGTGPKEPMQKVSIRMRYGRNPVIGDKFSSRHGQKGVLSQQWPDIDMPFSAVTGMRPDLIINPHAFPSRMTIGMLLESMAAKVGILKGEFINATPFQKCAADSKSSHKNKDESLVDKYGKQLKEYGFNYHGTEVMYSGVLGTELTCEIYIGCVYYQRLRHMVGDKYQVRSTGAVNPVTRQPVKGRKFGGGIRFGEMERDSLLAHGAAYLLHDRLHTCSDYHTADICVRCGSLLSTTPVIQQKSSAAFAMGLGSSKESKVICRVCNSSRDIELVAMPYVFRYLASELAAMNIKLTLTIGNG